MYTFAFLAVLVVTVMELPLASAFILDDLSGGFHSDHGGDSHASSSLCAYYPQYQTLHDLVKHDSCMDILAVTTKLKRLDQHSKTCRLEVTKLLAAHFGSRATTPSNCTCQGSSTQFSYQNSSNSLYSHCHSHNSAYRNLYDQFFNNHHHGSHPACMTHHSLWYNLNAVGHLTHNGSDCQLDIISALKYAFRHGTKCACTSKAVTYSSHTGGHTSHTSHISHACLAYSSYNVLRQLGEANACLSANSVWQYLDNLQVRSPSCRKEIQKYLAVARKNLDCNDIVEKFLTFDRFCLPSTYINYWKKNIYGNPKRNREKVADKYAKNVHFIDDCKCHARTALVNHQIHRMDNGSIFQCSSAHSSGYKNLEAELFSNIRAHGCRNHAYLWEHLESVTDYCPSTASHTHQSACIDCQQDLIVRTAIQYNSTRQDTCVCSKPFKPPTSTQLPTSTSTIRHTTKAPTTTTETPVTTAQYVLQRKFVCDEIAVVEFIAQATHTTHAAASWCNPNSGGSDDAYVLASCNVTSPMTWKRGKKVIDDCKSNTHLIPGFTPIATFTHGSYDSLGAQSGVFLECYHSGFKMAIQKCNSAPDIVHIESGGAFNNNPDNYYVIA